MSTEEIKTSSAPAPNVQQAQQPVVSAAASPVVSEEQHLIEQLTVDKREYARQKICSPMSKASWVEEYGEECKGVKKPPPEIQEERQLRFQANQQHVVEKKDKLIRKGLIPKIPEPPPQSTEGSV